MQRHGNPLGLHRLAVWPVVLGLLVACAAPASPSAPASKPAGAAPTAQSAAPAAQAPAAPTRGKQLLDDVVRKANAEGELSVLMPSTWNQGLTTQLAEAFKQRFGLTTNVTISPVLGTQHLPVAIAETRAGTPPTYDAVYGDDAEMMQLIGAGASLRVEDWEVLLYNPRLITEAELPRRHADLTEARFKDKFIQPPWTSHWEIAPAVLDNLNRDQWLDTVRAAGKNGGAVLGETPGAQRVALGQYAFLLGQDTNVRELRTKEPDIPIAARFMDDYNEYNAVYYAVRTGSRHPAAAALWVLWMTTPESEAIWQPTVQFAQRYGESEIDREHQRLLREAGSKAVSWLENPRTIELLEWYQTADGRQYLDGMQKAIKGE
jgi:extracellular solute-binding protein